MRLSASDDDVVLIHNPRCSKSRSVKSLLEERGVAHREIRYLDDPLTRAELEDLSTRLGMQPGGWVRQGESAYADAGLGVATDPDDLLAAMAEHPSIIQRPILVRGARARIGRPPEQALELLD